MKLRLVLPLIVLVGCGSKKDEKPPAPFTGPLTVERIMASKDAVKVFEAWDKALPKLEAKLGKPTKVDAAKGDHMWAAMEGDNCAYVVFSSGDGKEYGKEGLVVDMAQSPMTVAKDGPMMNRRDCLELVGKTEGGDAPDPGAGTGAGTGEGTGAGTGEGTGAGTADPGAGTGDE